MSKKKDRELITSSVKYSGDFEKVRKKAGLTEKKPRPNFKRVIPIAVASTLAGVMILSIILVPFINASGRHIASISSDHHSGAESVPDDDPAAHVETPHGGGAVTSADVIVSVESPVGSAEHSNSAMPIVSVEAPEESTVSVPDDDPAALIETPQGGGAVTSVDGDSHDTESKGAEDYFAEQGEYGTFYNIGDSRGFLSESDILSIAYYSNGGIIEENESVYPENYEPIPRTPETLDEEVIKKIESDYELINERFRSAEGVLDATLVDYLGTYGDYIAVKMTFDNGTPHSGTSEVYLGFDNGNDLKYETTGGYVWLYKLKG